MGAGRRQALPAPAGGAEEERQEQGGGKEQANREAEYDTVGRQPCREAQQVGAGDSHDDIAEKRYPQHGKHV